MPLKTTVICPACKQPVRFDRFRYCPYCNRYQSEKKHMVNLPDNFIPDNSGGCKLTLPWVREKGNKVFKWIALFVFLAFPLIFWAEGKLSRQWNTQEIVQICISLLSGYFFLILTFNKTVISIRDDLIVIARGPIPVPLSASYRVKRNDVERLDMYKVAGYKSTPETFPVYITTKDGKLRDILSSESEDEAIELYEYIRTTWNIGDKIREISRETYRKKQRTGKGYLRGLYQAGVIIALFLNIPAFFILKGWDADNWKFNTGFFIAFSLQTLVIFAIYFFHHRKYLNFWSSLPLSEDDKNPGILAYIILSIISSILVLPIAMMISRWF